VNYPLEYREIGFNDKLVQVIESNGGAYIMRMMSKGCCSWISRIRQCARLMSKE